MNERRYYYNKRSVEFFNGMPLMVDLDLELNVTTTYLVRRPIMGRYYMDGWVAYYVGLVKLVGGGN